MNKNTSNSTWALLIFAVCLEISGVFGLRFSEGFTLIFPTSAALVSFTLALYLVSRVMKTLPISVAYPVGLVVQQQAPHS
jgi:multidrug transporter EmrE-like cation transporter